MFPLPKCDCFTKEPHCVKGNFSQNTHRGSKNSLSRNTNTQGDNISLQSIPNSCDLELHLSWKLRIDRCRSFLQPTLIGTHFKSYLQTSMRSHFRRKSFGSQVSSHWCENLMKTRSHLQP